ncbi:V-type ATP synthase subunit E (V-type ATPase subunit E) [Treponema primitia ZAS-2]|uniref:V-type ATP synthase subunit E (V-type ATPase subunit E) n=1 Tax=Treponema primitia (strain ATCC BAA-887 / DSM 12427 / ZAS-2) TaxID=545694 RepID=F5YR75_TREPZ|nr:ATP synthase subunit E [Treponema primitia]AEF86698.1 V-type ATP synthase subunit E (V-type ATPase subunit E) [Treponema primitia ZAS-2]
MEIQLQELIDKIKKDGITSASEEASKLKSQAEADAGRITESARKEAAEIVSKAKADAERLEKAGTAALEQASRNLVLAFKGEIDALLSKIVAAKTGSSYGDDTLKAILPELVKSWASKGSDSLDLILSEDNLTKLRGYFNEQLASEISKGVELKSDRNLGAGFRIASKDGAAYYDFSAESVAELLSAYLNPRLSEILKSSAKGN